MQAIPDPWGQIAIQVGIAAIIMIASTVMTLLYPVQWMAAEVQVLVGALVITASAIGGAWTVQLAHGWWRKRGETV